MRPEFESGAMGANAARASAGTLRQRQSV